MKTVKSVAKGIVAAAGAMGIALADGHVTWVEICAVVVTVGGVYGIRNGSPDDDAAA